MMEQLDQKTKQKTKTRQKKKSPKEFIYKGSKQHNFPPWSNLYLEHPSTAEYA